MIDLTDPFTIFVVITIATVLAPIVLYFDRRGRAKEQRWRDEMVPVLARTHPAFQPRRPNPYWAPLILGLAFAAILWCVR